MNRSFLATLVTGFVMMALFAVFSLVLFVVYFTSPNELCYSECVSSSNSSDNNLKLFGAEVPDQVFPVLTGVVTLPSWIACLLLGHLLAFHIYFSESGHCLYVNCV